MSEQDVLNPVRGYSPDLGFSPNPDFNLSRIAPKSDVSKKAAGGVPYDRSIINDGYTFQLSWTGRPWICIQRIKRFYEQFRRGYFTFIDWEGGGRNYTGRITTMPEEVRVRNNVFSLSGVVFTEIPTLPLLAYPTDWDNDGAWLYPWNGFGDQDAAFDGTWAKTNHVGAENSFLTADNPGNANEDAQYEYLGYGFQLSMMRGPNMGIVNIAVDGVAVATIDLYAAQAYGPAIVLEQPKLPRDFHRVKITVTGNKNAAATAAAVSWHALRVIG